MPASIDMNPDPMPFGATIDPDGVWRQVLTRVPGPPRAGCLFLDRDGVLVEEVHYLRRVDDVKLIAGAARVVKAANELSVPVVVVTNQAGIGRGMYGWPEFAAVQEAMLDMLADTGAFVNAVFACPHHADGYSPYDVPDHPARKPNPGMLLAAADMMPLDLHASWIIGDRAGDVAAAKRAGCAGGIHVATGHGRNDGERKNALEYDSDAFRSFCADDIADAARHIPLLTEKDTP